jgi:hypothetical protein
LLISRKHQFYRSLMKLGSTCVKWMSWNNPFNLPFTNKRSFIYNLKHLTFQCYVERCK